MRQFIVILFVMIGLCPALDAATPDAAKSADVLKQLRAALAAEPKSLAEIAAKDFAALPLTREDAAIARKIIWDAHAAIIREERAGELKNHLIKDGKLEMPFTIKTFGKKPAAGWSLWFSLHGGGGTTKKVNDQQWENQKKLYKLDEGLYLVPRAPTNTASLWHEEHIDRMFTRLIEDLIVHEGVNPDRVYVLGYSAGGDGVYQIGPRMADSWAAAAMMAGHPNGVSMLSLRNLPFALQVGAEDAAYNRNAEGKKYGAKLDELQKGDPKGYEHFVKIREGKAHWMDLEDKEALPWMAKFSRNTLPEKVVWKQSKITHDRFYWLAVPDGEAKAGSLVIATRQGQTIEISSVENVSKLLIRLDDRMLNLDEPVTVKAGGKILSNSVPPRTIGMMIKTLRGRGDPKLMFAAEVEVNLRP